MCVCGGGGGWGGGGGGTTTLHASCMSSMQFPALVIH